MRTFASQGLTPQIVISYPIFSHLHHICASSYLRFLSQIFTSSLSSSGLHILRSHLVFTRSDLHRRVTLSLSYHLQDFIMQLLSQLYNLIYLRLQNFISPLSGQPSSSCFLSSGPVQLGAWPGGSWLPRWAAPLFYCCSWLVVDVTSLTGPLFRFPFSPAQWASPQLNGPVQW